MIRLSKALRSRIVWWTFPLYWNNFIFHTHIFVLCYCFVVCCIISIYLFSRLGWLCSVDVYCSQSELPIQLIWCKMTDCYLSLDEYVQSCSFIILLFLPQMPSNSSKLWSSIESHTKWMMDTYLISNWLNKLKTSFLFFFCRSHSILVVSLSLHNYLNHQSVQLNVVEHWWVFHACWFDCFDVVAMSSGI
jgi:hypothetical protein